MPIWTSAEMAAQPSRAAPAPGVVLRTSVHATLCLNLCVTNDRGLCISQSTSPWEGLVLPGGCKQPRSGLVGSQLLASIL